MPVPVPEANRLFLLALAALPALDCKDEAPTLQERCVDVLTAYYQCYGYGYGGAEIEAYISQYCTAIVGYAEQYGEGCVEAQLDIMACISELGCAMSDDFSQCSGALAGAHDKCPELYGTCLSTIESVGAGPGGGSMGCGRTGVECVDGNEYDISCNDDTGTLTCTCRINDTEVGTYAPVANCNGDFTAEATQACGFPENTP